MPDSDELVSVEKDGKILSGVGVTESDLTATMTERHPSAPSTDPSAPAPAPPSQRPTRGQKRFDELTGQREAERRRADAAEQRLKDLESQLADARKPPATPPAPQPPPPQPESPHRPAAPPIASNGHGEFPGFDAWFQQNPTKDFDDYLRDFNAHNLQSQGYIRQQDLDALIRRGIETDRETRARYEREGVEIQRGRAAYGPDFDAAVSAPHLMENNWPDYLIQAINSQAEPEHIKYRLGKDPQLAERIRTMNPVFAGYELAKLMPSAAVASTASTARTMATPPPAPMQPVAGGGRTTGPSSADLASRSGEDFDKSGYREQRARERGVSRRR